VRRYSDLVASGSAEVGGDLAPGYAPDGGYDPEEPAREIA
jgi:hypothetical protein